MILKDEFVCRGREREKATQGHLIEKPIVSTIIMLFEDAIELDAEKENDLNELNNDLSVFSNE